MLKYKNVKIIKCSDFDELVKSTYKRPYKFQQQDGCKDRGLYLIEVPYSVDCYGDDEMPSLEEWYKEPYSDEDSFSERLRWERDYYPNVGEVINDLFPKGLIEKGNYRIEVDW